VAGSVAATDTLPPAAVCASPRRQDVAGVVEAGLEVAKRVPLAGDAEGACWWCWCERRRRAPVEEEKARHQDYQNSDQRPWLGHVFMWVVCDGQLC
jgi:hypothetical protein